MNLTKSVADIKYKNLLKNPTELKNIINFFKTEIRSIIQLESLLRQCIDDTSYDFNFSLMRKELCNIRTSKFPIIKEKFGFFDTKAKHYFERLLKESN